MAEQNFTDVYENTSFINDIMKKHIDLGDDEDVLSLGIFGYLNELHANILQNSAIAASEYSQEAIPTKAKFPKNVLTHAFAVGLENIYATPAYMNVVLYLPEARVENNLKNNKLTLDRDYSIMISGYEYHIDYDIILRRTVLKDGTSVYTAQYDMSITNPLSDITSPYLAPIGRIDVSGTKILALQTVIRQVEVTVQEMTLTSANPFSNKTFNFSFENQMATFNIEVEEGGNTYLLDAIYDGLVNKSSSLYLYYLYIGTNTIRCMFDKNCYQPKTNATIKVHLVTTQGEDANFTYNKKIQCDLKSDRFSYNSLWMLVNPISNSINGKNSMSLSELKASIPTEQLARGSITNTTDLNNFFNSLNNSNRRLYFIKKLDSLERLYYTYICLKQDGNIIPTNTIDISVYRRQFDNIDNYNYILYPGNQIYYLKSGSRGKLVTSENTEEEIAIMKSRGFMYFNPFLMVVNKSPFYVSYLLNIMKETRELSFEYINQNSELQFIATDITWKREFFTDRNIYKLNINLMQNIATDNFDILIYQTQGTQQVVIGAKIKVVAVLKNSSGTPLRYAKAKFVSYDSNSQVFEYEFDIETDNSMDNSMNLNLTNVYQLSPTVISKENGYLPENMDVDIYVLSLLDQDYGRGDYIDTIVPENDKWTLTNKYSIIGGVPLYYNYTKVLSTFVNVTKGTDTSLEYQINKVPVIKYDYVNTEARLLDFIKQYNLVKEYIEYRLEKVEDSFGVDIKLFNTYGPANFFKISDSSNINSTSLSFKFKCKLKSEVDSSIVDNDLIPRIKEYIEDLTTLADFHAPNLQATITDEFSEQIVYFEFASFNGYGYDYQHIYREDFETDITLVPEILAVNIQDDNSPDITIELQ